MTTEKKLQQVFKSLEKSKNSPDVPEFYKMGINYAMDIIKLVFDREELEVAEIDVRLQFEIDKESQTV